MREFNFPSNTPRNGSLEVYTLGVVEFEAFLKLQDRLVFELGGREDQQAILLLCEHTPAISRGRCAQAEMVNKSYLELQRLNIEYFHLPRGGTCIPHVPGQLAVSLLLPIEKLSISPVEFHERLVGSAVSAARHFKIPADYDREQGVITIAQAVLGYAGSRVRFGITSFGVYLNINPWLEFFRLVQPPRGYEHVTSLNRELMKHLESAKVREFLIQHLASEFGYERVHLYTRHPMLARSVRKQPVHVPY